MRRTREALTLIINGRRNPATRMVHSSPRHWAVPILRVSILLIVWAASLQSQIHVTRGVLISLQWDDSVATRRSAAVSGLMEAQRGFRSADNAQAWNIKSSVMVQLRRPRGRSALVGLFANEMTSNPYNKLGYNPRGSIWEENILFVRKHQRLDWYAGLFFRSRHELDAATPVDELAPDSQATPTARIIGISGYRAAVLINRVIGDRVSLRAQVHAERYWHWKEIRMPADPGGPYWENATGALTLGGRLNTTSGSLVRPYARGFVTQMLFSRARQADRSPRIETNDRIETGIRLGVMGGADLFTAYERFFDELSRPAPRSTSVIYLGARFSSPDFF